MWINSALSVGANSDVEKLAGEDDIDVHNCGVSCLERCWGDVEGGGDVVEGIS